MRAICPSASRVEPTITRRSSSSISISASSTSSSRAWAISSVLPWYSKSQEVEVWRRDGAGMGFFTPASSF